MTSATDFIADLARSVGFLSRLPVPDRFFIGHDGSVSRAVRAFPLAGLAIGILPAALLIVLDQLPSRFADPFLSAFLALGLMTLLAGALHEDGLADAADGLGGGRDADHALIIMKDSRIGTYGVVALILSFGLRAAAVAALFRLSAEAAALSLAASASLSRAVLVAHWRALPPARSDGVAAGAGRPEKQATIVALAIGTALFGVALIPVLGPVAVVTALVIAGLASVGFTRFVGRKLGGHTGDTIGATQQLCEIALLVALALAG